MKCDICGSQYFKTIVLGHRINRRIAYRYCSPHYVEFINWIKKGPESAPIREQLGLPRNIQAKPHSNKHKVWTQGMSEGWKRLLSS